MTQAGDEADLIRVVLTDANVLYSRVLRDYLLYAADQEIIARREATSFVHPGGNVMHRDPKRDEVRWWTWAGFKANATLAATLSEVTDPMQRFDDRQIRMRADLTKSMWSSALHDAPNLLCLPDVNEKALVGLKFSDALPKKLAMATLAARLANLDGAASVLRESTRFIS